MKLLVKAQHLSEQNQSRFDSEGNDSVSRSKTKSKYKSHKHYYDSDEYDSDYYLGEYYEKNILNIRPNT